MIRNALCLAVLLTGCPAVDEESEAGAWPVWEAADAFEAEPNDEVAQDLGAISPNFYVAGRSSTCGADGAWEGADVDFLAFAFESDAFVRKRLRADGADLDLDLYDPDGNLLRELNGTGTDDELIDVSLEAGEAYSVRIRCWLGNDDRWILAFADRG
jgi:hypothetical protein